MSASVRKSASAPLPQKPTVFDAMISKIGEDRAEALKRAFKKINDANSILYSKFGIHPMKFKTYKAVLRSPTWFRKFTNDPSSLLVKVPSPNGASI